MDKIKEITDSIIDFTFDKISPLLDFIYDKLGVQLKVNNRTAFIRDKDHIPHINITHITEDCPKIRSYLQNWLDNLFLEGIKIEDPEIPESLQKGHHDKIYVEYTLNNYKYAICIKSEILDNRVVNKIASCVGLQRRVLSGYLVSESGERVDVSNLLQEFQGPDMDFYKNIGGVSNKWSDILYPYDLEDWEKLEINDLFGECTQIDINKVKCVDWNPNY